jgi:hypothetical protein
MALAAVLVQVGDEQAEQLQDGRTWTTTPEKTSSMVAALR